MSNGRRSKCGHFLLGLAVKQSSKAGGRAGGRAQDLGSLDLVDVLGRADQDFGNTGRLRQDTIRHRHTLAGEWIDGLGWQAGLLAGCFAEGLERRERRWAGTGGDRTGSFAGKAGVDKSRQERTQPWRCKSNQQDHRPLAWDLVWDEPSHFPASSSVARRRLFPSYKTSLLR